MPPGAWLIRIRTFLAPFRVSAVVRASMVTLARVVPPDDAVPWTICPGAAAGETKMGWLRLAGSYAAIPTFMFVEAGAHRSTTAPGANRITPVSSADA